VVERVRAEARLVVVERRRQRVEHPVDVPRVRCVVVDGEIDPGMPATLLRVAGRLDRELLADRRLRHEAGDAPVAANDVRHRRPGAIGVWSAVVDRVMSAVVQPPGRWTSRSR
jgi:hypothetical protein